MEISSVPASPAAFSPRCRSRTMEDSLADDGASRASCHSPSVSSVARGPTGHGCEDRDNLAMLDFAKLLGDFTQRFEVASERFASATEATIASQRKQTRLSDYVQKLLIPDYETLPEVEVTIKVYKICDVDTRTNQFFADVGVILDWIDPCLVRGEHYDAVNHATQQLCLFPALQDHVFNPLIAPENAVDDLSPIAGADEFPRIVAETSSGVWLKKVQRLRGHFAYNEANYQLFPFDAQALPICLKTMRSGKHKAPRVRNPQLRVDRAWRDNSSLKDKQWRQGHRVEEAHLHVGELCFRGFGVRVFQTASSPDRLREDTYELLLFFRRDPLRHFFQFLVLAIMVLASMISFCCPLAADAIAQRLSITLAVLLSLVSFAMTRPSAIEGVPYSTFYDNYAQWCTCLTAVMSLLNLVPVRSCDPERQETIAERCELGLIGATRLDDYIMIAVAASMIVALVVQARRVRSSFQRSLERWRSLCDDGGKVYAKSTDVADQSTVAKVDSDGSRTDVDGLQSQPRSFKRNSSLIVVKDRTGELNPLLSSSASEPSRRRSWAWAAAVSDRGKRQAAHDDPAVMLTIPLPPVPPTGTDIAPGTFVMDVGSSEVGIYGYSIQANCLRVVRGGKMRYDERQHVDLHDALMLCLRDSEVASLSEIRHNMLDYIANCITSSAVSLDRSLMVGITGKLQHALIENTELLELLQDFFCALERELSQRLGVQWSIRPFALNQYKNASFEQAAIAWLLESSKLGVSQSLISEPSFREYLKRELVSWAHLTGGSRVGALERDEFLDRFIPLSNEHTLADRFREANGWFDTLCEIERHAVGGDCMEVGIDAILNFMIADDKLLGLLFRGRLFAGSIAGGASAFQLSVMDTVKTACTLHLHTMPIGNMVPLDGVFRQTKITETELSAWQEQVTHMLSSMQWPAERRGLFVGISAMYYAALSAGINDQLLPRCKVLQSFQAALSTELHNGPDLSQSDADTASRSHKQTVANLVIALAIVERVLHEDAWLYCRREWELNASSGHRAEAPVVANWSLGWFLDGRQRLQDVKTRPPRSSSFNVFESVELLGAPNAALAPFSPRTISKRSSDSFGPAESSNAATRFIWGLSFPRRRWKLWSCRALNCCRSRRMQVMQAEGVLFCD